MVDEIKKLDKLCLLIWTCWVEILDLICKLSQFFFFLKKGTKHWFGWIAEAFVRRQPAAKELEMLALLGLVLTQGF